MTGRMRSDSLVGGYAASCVSHLSFDINRHGGSLGSIGARAKEGIRGYAGRRCSPLELLGGLGFQARMNLGLIYWTPCLCHCGFRLGARTSRQEREGRWRLTDEVPRYVPLESVTSALFRFLGSWGFSVPLVYTHPGAVSVHFRFPSLFLLHGRIANDEPG